MRRILAVTMRASPGGADPAGARPRKFAMNRVEAAIAEGRCVIALGSQLLKDADVMLEIRHRAGIPMVVLGGDAVGPVGPVSAEALAPCTDAPGGVLVLVEPDAAKDSKGLNAVGAAIQKGRNKPRMVVAARAFNPFLLPMALRLLKMEQERKRARDFLGSLPSMAPAAPAAAPQAPAAPQALEALQAAMSGEPSKAKAKVKAKGGSERAPRVGFSGRAEELSTLSTLLGEGGPIIIAGPKGIGRRWLVEHCLSESPLQRLPDVVLSWSSAADHLYARLAQAAEDAGDPRLAKAMRSASGRPAPAQLAELAVDCLQTDGLSDSVMVIHVDDRLMRDDGSVHRRGRLELLLEALWSHRYAPRLIFTVERQPVFYREGAGGSLRGFTLGGLAGKELYEIFDAYRFSEAPRDKMGEIHRFTHGHPMAARTIAVIARSAKDPAAALADRKLLKLDSIDHIEPLARKLRRRIERLADNHRKALATIAHLQHPAPADILQQVGIGREDRITLLAKGLLESTPVQGSERLYYVHPLVALQLSRREVTDYPTFETLGHAFLELYKRAKGSEKLQLGLEGNRCLLMARRGRSAVRLPFPDQDAEVESVRGLLRARQPRLDLAEQRLNYLCKADPGNTEALLLKAETLIASDATEEQIQAAFDQAAQAAPTPEVFHLEANWHQSAPRQPGKGAGKRDAAIEALQRGAALFTDNGRIRRRLAGLLLEAQREDEAVELLRETLELEPMMPDTYGLLGQIMMDRGPASWAQATEYLEEALRLSPEDSLHLARTGRLLRLRGMLEREQREDLWAQATEYFERAIQDQRRNHRAMVELATLLLDRQTDTDLDRVAWLLDKASKPRAKGKPRRPDKVLEARLAARRGRLEEAEAVLDRLVQRDPKHHRARSALAEVLWAKSRIFRAHAEFQRAQQDAPEGAPERHVYEAAMAQLQALIESGQAIELERQADLAAAERQPEPPAELPPVPAPARSRIRRRGGRVRLVDASVDIVQVESDEPPVPVSADDGQPEGGVEPEE
jgi:predicted Zn-dependent protease